jgi:hypothetical protein
MFLHYIKSFLTRRSRKPTEHIEPFPIDKGMIEPSRGVVYKDQLRILKTLELIKPNESFPITDELRYPVRRLTDKHFPEYKIVIRKLGDSYRVYRRA